MDKELSNKIYLSHYRILQILGGGGMGEVHLAEDTRLDRRVALKLLPADLAADEDRVRRSEQGARATSALNHPKILIWRVESIKMFKAARSEVPCAAAANKFLDKAESLQASWLITAI